MDADTFAFRLKELLEYKKLSLQAVATALGISRAAVHKWTRGGEIDNDRLRRLADFLGVNWIWLRYGEQAREDAESAEVISLPMTDVRRQYASEIMESEARMRLALENAQVVTWEWNIITDEVTYSHNVESIYGWKITRNEEFWCHVVKEDAEQLRACFDHAFATGEPYDTDFRLILGSGEVRWIASRATPIRDSYGRTLRMVGVSTDITDRRQADQALQDSEARFRSIFEQACGAMAYVGLDGRWLKVNQALCDMLGYSSDALYSMTFQDLTHEADLDDNLELLDQLVAGRIPMYQLDKRLLHAAGHSLWARVRTSLQRNPIDGTPEHLITLLEDVTEQRQQLQALQHKVEEQDILIKAAGVARWLYDLNSGQLHGNIELSQLLGKRSISQINSLDALCACFEESSRTALLTALQLMPGETFRISCRLLKSGEQVLLFGRSHEQQLLGGALKL